MVQKLINLRKTHAKGVTCMKVTAKAIILIAVNKNLSYWDLEFCSIAASKSSKQSPIPSLTPLGHLSS